MNEQPDSTGARDINRVFSARLDQFLSQVLEGETPNSGTFCGFCYNPIPPGADRCDSCGQNLRDRPSITSVPNEVIEMQRQKHKRESLVVNSFAYVGLAIAMTIFLGMIAIGVLYLDRALWFFVFATVVLIVTSRVLPGVIGGIIGDEIGYRYANKKLSQDWAEHVSSRENGRGGLPA